MIFLPHNIIRREYLEPLYSHSSFAILQLRDQQTFWVEGKVVNILDFVGCIYFIFYKTYGGSDLVSRPII